MDFISITQLLGNIGEFVGAIAVVVTLAYLVVQIRLNTRSNYVARGIALQQQLTAIHHSVIENVGLAELVARSREHELEDLSLADEERLRRFANLYVNTYASVENALRRGEFDQHQYDSYAMDLTRTINDYPALVPYMCQIVERFDASYYRILGPVVD